MSTGVGDLTIVRRGAAGAFVVQGLGAGLGLIAHLVVARVLGASTYGDYALALTWINVLSVFVLLGQDTAVIRLLPALSREGRWGAARGLRRAIPTIVFLASMSTAFVGVVVVYALHGIVSTPLRRTLLAGCVLLPVLAQLQLSGALHRALKRAISSGLFNTVLRPLVLIALILALAVAGIRMNAATAVLATAGAAAVALLISEFQLIRVWPQAASKVAPRYEIRPWLALGFRLFLLAAIGISLNRLDVLVLGAVGQSDQLGPYYIAVQLGAVAVYGLNAVNVILAPLLAERFVDGNLELLGELVRKASRLTFVITATVGVILAAAGYWLLRLFGPGFTSAYVPLLIILGGRCVAATSGPVGYLMVMTRFERQAPWLFGGAAALNLILSFGLIPEFGMVGAAVATASGTVACNVAGLIFVRRRLGINPSIFPWKNV